MKSAEDIYNEYKIERMQKEAARLVGRLKAGIYDVTHGELADAMCHIKLGTLQGLISATITLMELSLVGNNEEEEDGEDIARKVLGD